MSKRLLGTSPGHLSCAIRATEGCKWNEGYKAPAKRNVKSAPTKKSVPTVAKKKGGG
jgi:hypothetical protein